MAKRWLLLSGRNVDADRVRQRWQHGLETDARPYGAEHIEDVELAFSAPTRDRWSAKLGWIFGFDVVHAWRNRGAILSADVIYAHNEADHLAAALVLKLHRNATTVLCGQTIWLWDEATLTGAVCRWWARRVASRVDLFLYNALPNREAGARALPRSRHEYVRFGVSEQFRATTWAPSHRTSVISVGDDRSRDWGALVTALHSIGRTVRVASRNPATQKRVVGVGEVRPTASADELRQLYASATVMVAPTVPNTHAGGITTLLEAAAVGTPIVASRTGGLDDYFSDDEVLFVSARDPAALADAMRSLLDDPDERRARSRRLVARFDREEYSNRAYWRRVQAVVEGVPPRAEARGVEVRSRR